MLNFDEGEDVFFDSLDSLSSEESLGKEDGFHWNLNYEIWLNEPRSVKERRESFVRGMGLERIVECRAVSSCCASPVNGVEEPLVCNNRELNGEATFAIDELDQDLINNHIVSLERETVCDLPLVERFGRGGAQPPIKEHKNFDMGKNKLRSWWKHFVKKSKRTLHTNASKVLKPILETPKKSRVKVRESKKGCMELTAVYVGQEIRAHKGVVWCMKFSPNSEYLASGGQDGVIRIWRVSQEDASCKGENVECKFGDQANGGKSGSGTNKSNDPSIIVPNKVFQIEELPLQEFCGHTSDVLDLAWSESNCLVSASKDKTVRFWQVGCNECLHVFQHSDCVTCVQFNPADENYFITGSIDGKVRIWGVLKKRVVDWANVRDVATAICYHPSGNVRGFIVGSLSGTCRFYGSSDSNLQQNAQICFRGRKKSSSNKITSIQFTNKNSERVMITSEDSKVRILDGIEIVHKYRGLSKSRSQISASFTSTGRHIVSVGEDSRVYLWNYVDLSVRSSKHKHFERSCEHFFFEGITLAIPWSSPGSKHKGLDHGNVQFFLRTQDNEEASSRRRGFSNWFSMDRSFWGSATWPEEKIASWDLDCGDDNDDEGHTLSATWGLVIVTTGWDGMIRTFHNYGLPMRI